MTLNKKTSGRLNKCLSLGKYIIVLILFTCMTISCDTKCGNYAIFENCKSGEFNKESLREYKYETFKFKAPVSWELEVKDEGEFTNYQLINDNEKSIKQNNIETFIITTTTVSKQYKFKEEFEKFVAEQYQIENQMIYGIETFEDHQFENKAGIYIAGTGEENNMKYETMAMCILKDEILYWLNSTSHSEKEEDINICVGKEIISTFKTI